MIIRKAKLTDARGIARVHVDSWRATYRNIVADSYLDGLTYEARERLWNENLKNDNNYVAEDENGVITGFATGGKERTGEYADLEGELYAIYILPEFLGRGIGQRLVERVAEDLMKQGMNSMLVWVLKDNSSRQFYEEMGGREVDSKTIRIAGKDLVEVAYGWEDLSQLIGSGQKASQ
ncbi:GNAT family N-acetyltransferase [Planococcus sp. CAU13]|uniref:GNAT family N-acetyltransferase n=1 Tax=Planococcus sp. CAU13 TaxID=1541197 RepID=UPI00052FDDD9|nr:GNAT family N-acetyltransferase [Planococcus sp. CAU13]